MVAAQGDHLEQEQNQMKKDLAEVRAYAEAMADSNRAWDAYVDKEQDKFFHRINRQQADIDALKERMERSELRARVLELENKLLSARLDSMVDKLCFCTQAEATSQVVGSEISNERNSDTVRPRSIELSPSLSMPTNTRIIRHTSKRMRSRMCPSRLHQSVLPMYQLWSRLCLLTPPFPVVQVARFLMSQ